MKEIVWHGRGGQGAKTAATMLAAMAIHEGKYSQGSPEYGPERQGAPMKGYTRISNDPIRIHSAISKGDIVMVLDASLLSTVDILSTLKEQAILIVNTKKSSDAIREEIGASDEISIHTVDATGISLDEVGRNLPNTPLLGALVKVAGILSKDTVVKDLREKFGKKFSEKVVEGNVRAVERAYEEVK
ncbi:MAG: 2-oxoacid:acceptor oxidoreductase family protein [Planctomycetota bacterium]|nr:2-oxoacid:acceptor oxidoreductase family protein [Planctomycetota bacterium]